MDQLLQFASRHPTAVSLLVAAAIAVLVFELRLRSLNVGALSPQDAVRLMNQGAAVLDVRGSDAFAAGHINNARMVPVADLAGSAEGLKRFKDKTVIVYCDRGPVSLTAVKQLAALGFKQVFNLRGGLEAWRRENLPVVKKAGA